MLVTRNEQSVSVEAAAYAIVATAESISVRLAGEEVAGLRPSSAVDTMIRAEDGTISGKSDSLTSPLTLSVTEEDGVPALVWSAKSACWEKTEYILRLYETHAEYFVRVMGKGDVDTIYYFIGTAPVGSTYEFDTGFMPIPTVTGARQCEFSAQDSYEEFSYLTVPPLFCYVFDICGIKEKLALALAADPGEHNFTRFDYHTKSKNSLNRFWFTTDQAGHTHVDGTWKSPSILIYGTPDRHSALKFYADYYYETGRAAKKDPAEKKPRFWYGPMACGWIEQYAQMAASNGTGNQNEWARQSTYDRFNAELERRDLHPQILIIDDQWQAHYGTAVEDKEKWPDLRGWIDENRTKYNRHVMLWFKLWSDDGLPDDCCLIDRDSGARFADPTAPAYRAYLRETMHRLLSADEGCLNADGLKLDFAFTQPVGRNVTSYDGRYGVELYLELIRLIYEYAKEAKPEAVISGSPCHPLFARYIDHARLHDYCPNLRRCYEEFAFRKEIYEIAMPGVLFDTDGAGFSSHRDTMRYLTMAPELGIPDLYCITDMPSIRLTDEDWAKVAAVWKEYGEWIDECVKD